MFINNHFINILKIFSSFFIVMVKQVSPIPFFFLIIINIDNYLDINIVSITIA